MHWADVYNMPNISFRLFNAYGPRSRTTGAYGAVFGVFLAQKLANKPLTIVGDGNQTRDFIYVDDVITAIINSTELPQQGIINVGSGISTSFNQIIEKIGIITGKKITPQYIKKESAYVENLQADTRLMKSSLKINPISLDSGIAKFAQYLGII